MDFERLDHMPSVKVVMTPFPYCVEADASLARAREMMVEHDIHHLPVTDGRNIVGTLSAFDIASRAQRDTAVADCYVPEPYLVEIDVPLEAVLTEMAVHRLEAAIVMRHGRLAGIFTQHDVCRTFAAHLHAAYPPPPDDQVA